MVYMSLSGIITNNRFMKKIMNMVNGEQEYTKIDNTNGTYMPLVVEKVRETEDYFIFSMAHYYEQNGDLMRDPEMTVLYHKQLNMFFPESFQQDGLFSKYQQVFQYDEQGKITGKRPKLANELCSFMKMWAKNIQAQQRI